MIIAALPALFAGFYFYGIKALGVVCLSISFSMIWELLFNIVTKEESKIDDGSSAVIGMLFAMMLPATAPWWLIIVGTFVAVIVGREIFGGIGSNPFNPALIGIAIVMVSWGEYFDFNQSLISYDMDFKMFYPLAELKYFGVPSIESLSIVDLMFGKQPGAIGAVFGIGLILGGVYLIIRGFIRWEISVSFIIGIALTAMIFSIADPAKYAGPFFHLFTGYTLLGAFFLSTEDSSSPVNFIPMIIYGIGGGVMTVLIRSIGAHIDGVVFAILIMNLTNPLIDKIKPRAFGKVR
jgi:electron transport complex protein RnfD